MCFLMKFCRLLKIKFRFNEYCLRISLASIEFKETAICFANVAIRKEQEKGMTRREGNREKKEHQKIKAP